MGFLAGSLVLIVGYVLLQQGSADRVDAAGKVSVSTLRRLLSGDVAGIPQTRKGKAAKPGAGGGAAPKATSGDTAGGVWI